MSETLYGALAAIAQRHGELPAYVVVDDEHDETLSFAALDRQAASVAAELARRGFERGDRLAVWLPNLPEWLVLQVAASRLGVAVISINTKYRTEELNHILALGRPRGIAFAHGFLGIDFAGLLDQALADADGEASVELIIAVRGTVETDSGPAVATFAELAAGPSTDAPVAGAPEDLAILFPTSGTTSLPKLAAHDQGSIVRHAGNVGERLELGDGDVLLCPLPLCGVFGYSAIVSALLRGVTCLSQPAFSGPHAAELGRARAATHFIGTDPMLEALIAAGEPRTLRGGIVSVTTDRPQLLIEAAEATLGVALSDVYGSSECFALLAFWPPDAPASLRAIKGGELVSSDIEVRIIDQASKEDLPAGERGEILFRGYSILRGYLGDPAATENALTHDGWYRTGDLGYLDDDGRLVFLNRLDDSLRLRGFLVNPGEIEDLLESHPSVQAAQVVGVKDSSGKDLPVAFVIPRGDVAISEEDVRAYCRERAARYKVPEAVWFVDDFPRTVGTNGFKVQRNLLRSRARELMSSEHAR